MDQPTVPCFLYDRRKHFVDLWDTIELGQRMSRLILVTEWDLHCTVFDSSGTGWTFRFERDKERYSMVDRLLAEIYNPTRVVPVAWTQSHDYSVAELQNAYLDALDHDDDFLTQFVEGKELRERIEQCRNFQDVVATWRWMQTDSA